MQLHVIRWGFHDVIVIAVVFWTITQGSARDSPEMLAKQYGAQISPSYKTLQGISISECQNACIVDGKCIALSFQDDISSCSLSTWDPRFAATGIIGNHTATFYQQKSLGNATHTPLKPAVAYSMTPVLTGIALVNTSIFPDFFKANLAYLDSFVVDDML